MIEKLGAFYGQNPLAVFSLFIIGFLLIIFIQNIFFYRIYKDKAYLWYTIYALLIILDQGLINFTTFYTTVLEKTLDYIPIHPALEWLYNSAYLIFVIEFGGLFLFKKHTATIIKKIVYYLAGLLVILFVVDVLLSTFYVRLGFLLVLVPALIILSIFIYIHLFKMKTPVKYYIIFGSLAFSIFSILALSTSLFTSKSTYMGWSLFYIGVFIENIFFSLGLVKKQSIILDERNETQQKLIEQFKENEILKNSITETLEREVAQKTSEIVSLNKKAEQERIKQIELAYQKEIAELKITSLQSQMNPHFIFNSLNSIKLNIIKNNKENAVYYLNKFSKLIRKILNISREKEVSLRDELDTLELYVAIENLRFKNEINFTILEDDFVNLETVKIPPLILQPFIENAIWHGLSLKEGEKALTVSVKKKNGPGVSIVIEDNGIGRKEAQKIKDKKVHKRESLGLKLTQERLNVFSKSSSISFEDLIGKDNTPLGTRVIIDL